MLKNLLLIIFALTILNASAQLSFKTDSVYFSESPATVDPILCTNYLFNESDEAITYKWVRTEEILTSSWLSAVCDATTCWSPTTSSTPIDNLITIEAGDSTKVELNFFNEGRVGEGYVEVIAFDVADSANTVVTSKYYGKAENEDTDVSINNIEKNSFNIYPNPAKNAINIKGIENISAQAKVEIYSIIGVKVAEVNFNNESIDVSNLQNGVYLLKVNDKNQSYSQTFMKQ